MDRSTKVLLIGGLMVALVIAARALAPLSGSGRTRQPMDTASTGGGPVVHATAQTFPGLLSQGKPVLVDFWAPWCGPCRLQGPILEQAAQTLGDRAIVAKVNVDDERQLASDYGVRSIPTLVLIRNGKVVQQFVGVTEADALVRAVAAAGS